MIGIIFKLLETKIGQAVAGIVVVVAAYFGFVAWLAFHDAGIRKEALRGYVQQSQLDEALATNNEIKRQLEAGRRATDLYAEMLAEAQEKDRQDDERTKQKNAIYEAQLAALGRSCRIDQSDRDFLRDN